MSIETAFSGRVGIPPAEFKMSPGGQDVVPLHGCRQYGRTKNSRGKGQCGVS